MLRSLEIRDMLIIDRLDLAFQPGLNVLTGETGAGKSILLDSLGFVLGWRGRADLVRTGAGQAEVTAEFDLPAGHAARAVLKEAGVPEGETLILRRINTRDGRKTSWVNDRRVSGEILRALSDTLIELHGQQDDRGLLNPRGHRQLLDDYAALSGDIAQTRAAWRARAAAQADMERAEAALCALKAEEEFLRHAVEELDSLSPVPGEDAVLDARRRAMQVADRVREDIVRAHAALSEGGGAEARMGDALRWLEGTADIVEGTLDPAIEALGRAMVELGEAVQGVEACLGVLEFDPADLEATEERLFALRALARKHGVQPDDLGGLAEDLRRRLCALDGGEADLAALRMTLDTAHAAYEAAARRLTQKRHAAARALDAAMTGELAPLKMERAVFTTLVTSADPGPEGGDTVTFQVATNPGAPAGPLNKIASGGELSRFLLALKVCLTQQTSGQTLIFDEIDRGVGGATADAVGRRLAALAGGGQVLVVTHSPQVAALAAHHWRVEKKVRAETTLSSVTPLTGADRIDEIARMISGDTITPQARAAAQALLEG
ncbi:DNA replication and repair protein RecN [Rhodovulum imhoffii]|uniref:DNA repair protein RecN n=1 Tax=Rhodovulum imhoffii TaxID=365340 RepID=A0A2T5BPJ8_9RHOB|nr:DNA repair protein RecN [Rhodovulum imhoffii]MBK5932899.1 DNA repair protein RecN [Rhodovulum imhoffii]PTN00945.1 DNA replication and repair protein RecN [Rhodovulum imhoffii]